MNLDSYRKRIDDLDDDILRLLNERLSLAAEVGRRKLKAGMPIYVPGREEQIFARLLQVNPGPLTAEMLRAVYREIISAARSMEKPFSVAYLGPPSTFSHQAARLQFGSSAVYQPCETISDVFNATGKKTAAFGVVPVENSSEGGVTETLDQFLQTGQTVCAEVYMTVRHHLLALDKDRKLQRLYSHPQALAQCRQWLQREMPGIEVVPATSTARAAEKAAADPQAGALAGSLAAELYGLSVRAADIHDESDNMTRFLVLGPAGTQPTGNDKTSVFFSVKHKVGALYGALKAFKQNNLNLTRIESRPSRKRVWEYFFFVDFEGHTAETQVARALNDAERHCTVLTILGSYPRKEPGGEA